MAKLSVSVDVPLPPEKAWACASDLSRYKEWLTIHRVWRSKLPENLEKGAVLESIVEVKGMPNRIKWTIVHFKPPEAMTLNGDGRGGVKVKLIAKVKPDRRQLNPYPRCAPRRSSIVRADRHGGGRRAQGRHPRVSESLQVGVRAGLSQRRNRLETSLVNSTVERRTDSSSSDTPGWSTRSTGSAALPRD